jgi:hypothetical protein
MNNVISRTLLAGALILVLSLDVIAGPTGDAISEGLGKLKGPASATVKPGPPKWIYTVTNKAPKGSSLVVKSLNFDLYGPAEAVNLPKGWTVDTDGKGFVLWSTEKNGIAPGESLSFELKSSLRSSQEAFCLMVTWDEKAGKPGPVSASRVKIPK